MIVGPDATAINDIVLLENDAVAGKFPPSSAFSGAGRLVYTEIDEVFLLCNACEHGACKIDYWIRGEENITECVPQSPCCPKCPQWKCSPCEVGSGDGLVLSSSSTEPPISNNVVLIEQDGEVFAITV